MFRGTGQERLDFKNPLNLDMKQKFSTSVLKVFIYFTNAY